MGRRRRTEDEESCPSSSSSSRRRWKKEKKKEHIQFFKIIHSGILGDEKLELPSKFIRKVGNHLSDVVLLKVPNDQVWKVELEKSDKSIWFHNGWQEFVEYHSIRAGHFLVFKYLGGSCFDVLIFDISCAEIQYPCDAHKVEDSNNGGECPMHNENKETEVNDDDDDDSVEFLDGHDETCTNQEESIQMHVEKICWASMTTSMKQKVQKSIEAVQDFKSNYPFYMLVMYSTYIRRGLATVNKKFAKRYLPGNKGSLSLTVSGGGRWNMNYCSSSYTSITTGWNKFVRENELEVGDVCVFELINRNDILLKVSIFRNGKMHYKSRVHNGEDPADARECPMPKDKEIEDGHETCRNRDESVLIHRTKINPCTRFMRRSSSRQHKLQRETEVAQAFKSNNPFYMLVMSPRFMCLNYATVKASFSTRYLPDKILGSLTLMVSDGRTWHVNYSSKRSNTNTVLTKGWIDFVRENELKKGDVCVFELINRDALLLKVSIFRNAKKSDRCIADNVEDPNYGRLCSVPKKEEIKEDDSDVFLDGHGTWINEAECDRMRRAKVRPWAMRRTPSINKENQSAIKAARAFKSKNPFFMLVMYSTYIRNSQAAVKADFATRYLPEDKLGCLALTVSDGRTWHVNYTSRNSNTNTSMNKGWREFVRENELEVGDVCVFELVHRDDLLLKASIFRVGKKRDRHIGDNVDDPNYGRLCSVPKKQEINEDDSVVFLDAPPNGHETCTNQEESVGTRLAKRRLCSTPMRSNPSKKRKEQRENEPPRAHEEQKAIQAAEAFKSNNPFYISVMCSTYVQRCYMWVSPIFARRYLSGNKIGSLILTVPDGRTWPVKYISRRKNTYTSLAKGWVTFVKETGLEEDDVCVFELIDRKNLLLKVSIFRDAKIRDGSKIQNDARKCAMPEEEEKEIKIKTPDGLRRCTHQGESDGMLTTKRHLCSASIRSNPSKKQKKHRESETTQAQKKQLAIEAAGAGAFKSDNPFYICVMCPTYLHSSFIWVSPKFAKIYFPKAKFGSLTLTVPDGRTWTVNYISRRKNRLTRLSRGWNEFVKENELEEGDVCVFELINRKNLLVKVSTFRVANML